MYAIFNFDTVIKVMIINIKKFLNSPRAMLTPQFFFICSAMRCRLEISSRRLVSYMNFLVITYSACSSKIAVKLICMMIKDLYELLAQAAYYNLTDFCFVQECAVTGER